jgi:hypothetical protein
MSESMRKPLEAPPPTIHGVCLFQVCGLAGALAGCGLAASLAKTRELPLWFVAVLIACTLVTQIALALCVKLALHGRERLVFYHHAVVFVLTTVAVAAAMDQPVRPSLDVVTPALFAFLAFGRIGCWTAGCCYGLPSRFGLVYGQAHSAAVAPAFEGVPLWPVQITEALVAATVAIAGMAGVGFETCFATYALARFVLEYLRGDPDRGRLLHLTEAQWTSAAVMLLIWPLGAALLTLLWWVVRPWPPDHVVQLARALACARNERVVATTSFGISVTREAGVLRVLTPADPQLVRRVAALDRLLCTNRNE